MSHLDVEKQSTLADVGDLLRVRFERLNVLTNALNDVSDEYVQLCVKLNKDTHLASRIQSVAAFLTTELLDAEKEFEQVVEGGES